MAIGLLAITDPGCAVSTRYRVRQYEKALLANGVQLQILAWPGRREEQEALLDLAGAADAVLFQRYLPHARLIGRFRRQARRLVYDFDDAVIFHESTRHKPRLKVERWWRFREMASACDAVTAGNAYLAGLAERYAGHRVFVLPTTVESARYQNEPGPAETGPVLGWIGGHWTLPYLERLRHPLERLSAEAAGLTVRVIADKLPDLGQTSVELIGWQAATEAWELKQLRAGLAPLPDDAWTRGKCGLRLLQYLAAGVPAVASPVGTQARIIEEGAALAASTEDDWLRSLRLLLHDAKAASALAARGRQVVREQFDASIWVDRLCAYWCGKP